MGFFDFIDNADRRIDAICPRCEKVIPLDDVNIRIDVALCRSCGQGFSYSTLQDRAALLSVPLDQPPRQVQLKHGLMGEKVIRYKRISPIVLFLIPFTAFWSGFSIWGIYIGPLMKGQIELESMLFGIPFLIGTIVLISSLLVCMLGRWVITLHEGKGTVFYGVGKAGWTRRFEYNRDTLVSLKYSGASQNDVPQKAVLVKNGQRELMFGSFMKEDCKYFIAAVLLAEFLEP